MTPSDKTLREIAEAIAIAGDRWRLNPVGALPDIQAKTAWQAVMESDEMRDLCKKN